MRIDKFFFKRFKQLLVYCQTWVVDRIYQSADISRTETLPPKLPGWRNNVSTVWRCVGPTCLLWTSCFLWYVCPCVWKKRDALTSAVRRHRAVTGRHQTRLRRPEELKNRSTSTPRTHNMTHRWEIELYNQHREQRRRRRHLSVKR